MQVGNVIVTIEAKDTTFSKTLDTAGDKLTALGGKMVSAGSKVSMGLLPITNAIQGFGRDAIDSASAMGESLSKVNVVFGQNAAEIVAWSKTSADAFGLSQQKALAATGTLGNLFSALGVVPDASKKMSMSIVELA